MAEGSSYQLPDLLSLTRDFELRTNRHCRSVVEASNDWFLDLNTEADAQVLTEVEIKHAPGLKAGLLASLCFPTCDLPQLRLAADFIGLLLISNERVKTGGMEAFGWDAISPDERGSFNKTGFIELLEGHALLKHLVPRLSRLRSITTPRWQKQFTTSLLALRDAQSNAIKYRRNGTVLALDDYVDLSRDLSGLRAVFDLVESSEGLNLDLTEMTLDDADDFRMLRRVAAETIALSFDIFSLNNDQLAGNRLNVVEVLMSERCISLQAAVNEAGHLVKDKFDAFKELETSLWARHPRENANGSSAAGPKEQGATLGATLSTWIRKPRSLSRSSSRTNLAALFSASEASKWDTSTANDASLFLQGLKDCMGGSLHWSYETELFFGSKGEAIRNFGWIFLSSQDG